MADIGKPEKEWTIEPVVDPVPKREPAPVAPTTEPEREPAINE